MSSSEGTEIKSKPTIAVLGATGGCVLAFLIRALKDGYNCSALVRTPSKLTDLLKSNQVPEELVTKHLTVIQGSSKDTTKLTELLFQNNNIVDIIVSGIGGAGTLKPNPFCPLHLDDPNICEGTTKAVLSSLKTLQSTHQSTMKPLFIIISSTGISDHGRDFPLVSVPLYSWLLPVPLKDKKAMEKLLIDEIKAKSEATIGGFVAVRPSVLTNKTGLGVGGVRAAAERDGKIGKEAIGYSISRWDVGAWIFEVLVEDKEGKKEGFVNSFVTITS